jgi:putative hydrolase of the HAD superfamily
MISVVLFDLGNVLLPFEARRLAKKLTFHTHKSEDELLEIFGKDHIFKDFEEGTITPSVFFDQIKQSASLSRISLSQFTDFFNDIFNEDPHVIQLLDQLKPNYRLGLISNTNTLHATYLMEKYPFFDQFDRIWFSHEVGARKPGPSIYQTALDYFNVPANETVFIDDTYGNVVGAQNLGMRGIHFLNYEQLSTELKQLGVKH